MHLPQPAVKAIGWLAYEFARFQPLIPTYMHLMISALFPIFAGAHASLSRPSSAAKPEKHKHQDESLGDEEDTPERKMEGLSPSDAISFPILAGVTLTGLYFLIKWLKDIELLNKILNWYFAGFSVFSVANLVTDGLNVAHSLVFPRTFLDQDVLFSFNVKQRKAISADGQWRSSPLPGALSRLPVNAKLTKALWFFRMLPSQELLTLKARIRHMVRMKLSLAAHGIQGIVVAIIAVWYYNFVDKPWWLTNLMGFGFAYGALQIMSPTTYWTGTLILCALFFYDIYFVFFTPFMVTVAKSLDVPIKLVFPRPPEPDADPATQALSMLGLGDVVLPGLMIGLALRFDLFMFYLKKQKLDRPRQQDASENMADNTPNDSKTIKGGKYETKNSSSATELNSADESLDGKAILKKENLMIIKAPYTSASGGWGDRLWTTRLFSSTPSSYVPRGYFPKPYFKASVFAYITGLLTTLVAMQLSNHPQPALLYLVPTVLCSLWLTGWVRGELREMWAFSDTEEESGENKPAVDEENKVEGQTAQTRHSKEGEGVEKVTPDTKIEGKKTHPQRKTSEDSTQVREAEDSDEAEITSGLEANEAEGLSRSTEEANKSFTLVAFYVRKLIFVSVSLNPFWKTMGEGAGEKDASLTEGQKADTKEQQWRPRSRDTDIDEQAEKRLRVR